jgi:hypothetical protein
MEALSGLFVAIGVAAAAGLNAPLPLLLLGALDRWTGLVELASPWDALAQPEWLIGLSVLTALDLVGDKIPAVDHVLHVVGLVGAPVAGALAAMAGSSTGELAPVIAAVTGAIVAEGTHVARAGVRPVFDGLDRRRREPDPQRRGRRPVGHPRATRGGGAGARGRARGAVGRRHLPWAASGAPALRAADAGTRAVAPELQRGSCL